MTNKPLHGSDCVPVQRTISQQRDGGTNAHVGDKAISRKLRYYHRILAQAEAHYIDQHPASVEAVKRAQDRI